MLLLSLPPFPFPSDSLKHIQNEKSFYLVSYIVIVLSFNTADATLTQEVKKFVSNKSLLNPNIDTSVTIFGRHSGEKAEFVNIRRKFGYRKQ